MKRKWTTLLLGASMTLALGGMAFAEEADVNEDGTVNNPEAVQVDENKLVFWSLFTGGDGEYMQKIIDDYNAGGPTKEVQSITLVWDDYYTKLQTAVAAKKGPDIGISHASKLSELVDQGVVESISPYLEELGVDLSTMYAENSLDAVTYDGEIYAVPLDTHAEILYYNTDILEKAGVELNEDGTLSISSADEFTEILDKCKAVMEDGQSVIALTNNGDDPYRTWWATYFQMGGTPLVNDEGTEVTLDKDIAVQAAEWVKSLYDNGYVLEGISDHQKLFQAGDAAFLIGGTWAVGVMEETEGLNFGAQSWPQLFDNASCWADSHTLILPVNPDRTEEETLAAVEFLVSASKDGGATWAGSGQIPACLEVVDSDAFLGLPCRENYKSALDNAVLPSKNPAFYAMKAGMIESLDTLWTGTADAAGAIDALYNELESNLQ
ncbi:ABC transporter, solute-binding protein [Marvinbryantia formatexigens DSM 14469]|uniref:ABC transporter, solute-binding protein n=1 Tax=Marvinbryantia formatexigens DSM 14469 TaxID=478749 RepID=C6LHS2_9FIRM|nr:extracellular solute-binding protein [Marvinbryantia formatexigens]EET59812.1 ABC transporter, solute-binding protein [Marvinbryantia formatexigens DSM 14469]UWO23320.1 extracellular solute-binding protein [Marvinbryantia formatexigens DSM 14469]SDG41657.1 multiple sugar transport system substrate-binding protein [Marvinbryantia formatexigens]